MRIWRARTEPCESGAQAHPARHFVDKAGSGAEAGNHRKCHETRVSPVSVASKYALSLSSKVYGL